MKRRMLHIRYPRARQVPNPNDPLLSPPWEDEDVTLAEGRSIVDRRPPRDESGFTPVRKSRG